MSRALERVSELQDGGCSQKGPLPRGDHGHVDRRHNEDVTADFPGGSFPSSQLRGERGGPPGNGCSVPGALWSIWCCKNTISNRGSLELSFLCSLMGTDYLCAPREVTLCEPGLGSQNSLSAAPGRVGESLLLPSRCQPASPFFPEWKQGNTTGAWGNGRMELWAREQELAQRTRREETTSSSGGPSRKKMLISQTRG